MKATMLSKSEMEYANYHLHDGLEKTVEGLNALLKINKINIEEHDQLMQQAIHRHLALWRAFTHKLVQKTLCLLFVSLFTYMQVNGEDLDMRRSSRTRTTSRTSRSGRRRNESESIIL